MCSPPTAANRRRSWAHGCAEPHSLCHGPLPRAAETARLVADALNAPPWRWVSQAPGHAALTVIRYPPDAPASVMVFNDMAHLPERLRWTGFSDHLHL